MAFMLLLAAAAHPQRHCTLAQLKHSKAEAADNAFVTHRLNAVFVIIHESQEMSQCCSGPFC